MEHLGVMKPSSSRQAGHAGVPQPSILAVDDREDGLIALRTILEGVDASVVTASSGNEALSKAYDSNFAAILLDVRMPDISGFDVLQRIRDTPNTASLPVILISAKGGEDDTMTGYQYGADYYITKPCTAAQLLYGVGLVLGRNFEESSDPAPAAASTRPTRATG